MLRTAMLGWCCWIAIASAEAATLHVPRDHKSLQAAVDAAQPGDTVLVSAGIYRERVRLRDGVHLRSAGDDTRGAEGLRRAEETIIDGENRADQSGIIMAEGSSLNGFTITNVGTYDEAVWKRHFDSHGEELGDEEGAVQAEGTHPAIRVEGVTCSVSHCLVHHNGDVGIGILGVESVTTAPVISDNVVTRNMGGGIGVADGAEPWIRRNLCRQNLRAGIGCRGSNPIIIDNRCVQNVRAGIGCREGAQPIIRRNQCVQNRRAGIGIRMEDTSPLVEANECYENAMAGIGCRDGASPILRKNVCRKNLLAGIGCRDGARPLIVDNECRDNEQAGIGIQKQSFAVIQGNTCIDNKTVAIGVIEQSKATIIENRLSRVGGQPPIIAVKDGSTATIRNNRIAGGGVAAVLIEGKATIGENEFNATAEQQGNAVWVWEGSTVVVSKNSFDGYRSAVNASKSAVLISDNSIQRFQNTAIIVKLSSSPAHVVGNRATSNDPNARVVDVQEPVGVVERNELRRD